jgi:hypothetical protein
MEITMDKIVAAEADVARLVAEEQRMRREAEADGTVDPKEKADLDRIKGKITKGQEIIARLRSEYEANKALWDSKAGDFAALKGQVQELADWGEPAATGLSQGIAKIEADAAGEQWKAATAALDTALTDILEPWAEYQRQLAARSAYEPERAAFDARLAEASATHLKGPNVVAALSSVSGAGAEMDARAAARDYAGARDILLSAVAQVEQVEADIATLAAERDAYLAARAEFDTAMGQIAPGEFKRLAERHAALQTKAKAIDAQAMAFDFAGAQAATGAASEEAKALLVEVETTRLARDGYQALLQGVEARLAEANAEGVPELAPRLAAITAKVEAAKPLAEAEDFAGASTALEAAAEELGGFEETLAQRRLYLERLDDVMPKVVERGVSTEHNAFIQPLQQKMADAQTAMEAAARALDFAGALTQMDAMVAALDEIEQEIAARREEFGIERDIQSGRLDLLAQSPYPEITGRLGPLETGLATAQAACDAEKFDEAMDELAALAQELDLLEQDVARIDTELKEKIEKTIAPVETQLPDLAEPPSPSLAKLQALVKSARAAQSSGADLLQGVKDAEEAAKMVVELAKVHTIMKRIEDKWGINQDDEARAVVAELKASGDLNALPMEARNYLVEKMLSGVVSDDDHKAIQDVWSEKKFVDRQFNEVDKPIRDKIVEAFEKDPKIQEYKSKWAGMTDAEKLDAIKYMTKIPAGSDGWNVGQPANFEVFKQPSAPSGSTLLGDYNSGKDRMRINIHPDAEAFGFNKMIDTIAHEIGHKQQAALIKGVKDGTIKPGDPRYNQGKALQLCEEYRNEHNSEFKKIYESSPEESHSRTMGDEVRQALNILDAGGGHAGHGHGP